jgi:hypothetical protein
MVVHVPMLGNLRVTSLGGGVTKVCVWASWLTCWPANMARRAHDVWREDLGKTSV